VVQLSNLETYIVYFMIFVFLLIAYIGEVDVGLRDISI
jgi:hypothetical protein